MTLLELILKNSDQRITRIKCVKNAAVFQSGNIVYCLHYDTVIFALDLNTRKAEILKNLSPTSNRQIKYLVEFFNPTEITNLNEGHKKYEKWSFSEPLR